MIKFFQETNDAEPKQDILKMNNLQGRVLHKVVVTSVIFVSLFLCFNYCIDNFGGIIMGLSSALLLAVTYGFIRMNRLVLGQHVLLTSIGPLMLLAVFIGGNGSFVIVGFFPVVTLIYLLYRHEKYIYFYALYFAVLMLVSVALMIYSPEPKLLSSAAWYSYPALFVAFVIQMAALSIYRREISTQEHFLAVERKKIEANALLMQATLESGIDGILIIDKAQNSICANQKFLEMWQLAEGMIAGQPFKKALDYLLVKIVDSSAFVAQVELLENHAAVASSVEIELHDGRFFEVYAQVLSMAEGEVSGKAFNFRNITARKKTEQKLIESESLFRSLFEEIPIGVVLGTHHDDCLSQSNTQFRKMLGYTKEELAQKKVVDITAVADRGVHKEKYHQVWHGELELFEMEKRYIRKDKSTVWGHTTVAVARDADGKVKYDIAMIQDITQKKEDDEEIKKLLAALKRQNEELEEQVALRTQSLQDSNEELVRSNQDLAQFAYIASHDLQEPLRTVGNFVQLLNRREGAKISEEGKEYLDFIKGGVGRMSKLISSLLEYSKVGRKDVAFRTVDVNEMIGGKLQDLMQRIKESNAEIWVHELPQQLSCEPNQLSIVFYNLLANALKFNKNKKAIIILSHQERETDWLFSVKDNGIGIEPQFQEKVFEIFKRLNRREEFEGTGIGLALCKRIINRHAGTIWFDSSLNKGTTFYFTVAKDLKVEKATALQN